MSTTGQTTERTESQDGLERMLQCLYNDPRVYRKGYLLPKDIPMFVLPPELVGVLMEYIQYYREGLI